MVNTTARTLQVPVSLIEYISSLKVQQSVCLRVARIRPFGERDNIVQSSS